MTDVQGSTRLWRDSPDAMDGALARHSALLDEAVEAHGGWRPLEQGEGDSAVLVFRTASAAVAAAIDLQRALHAEPWPTPSPLLVRMGVHVGDVLVRGRNVYGDTLNRCARIRGIAHGGQTLVS